MTNGEDPLGNLCMNELTPRAQEILRRLGVQSPYLLDRITLRQLYAVKGAGRKTIKEITMWAISNDVGFKPEFIERCKNCERLEAQLIEMRHAAGMLMAGVDKIMKALKI